MEIEKRCANCKHYDPTPFPEYNGRLAICKNKKKHEIGDGKIGIYTVANKMCFEPKAQSKIET